MTASGQSHSAGSSYGYTAVDSTGERGGGTDGGTAYVPIQIAAFSRGSQSQEPEAVVFLCDATLSRDLGLLLPRHLT